MKIAFFETQGDDEKSITELFPNDELFFSAEKLNADSAGLIPDTSVVSIFINSEITADVLDHLPNLRLIATRSTGYDHIDIAAAAAKGVAVATVPAYGARTVAEFTFGLILNLSRKICDAYLGLQTHDDFSITRYEGFNLYGKTLGVIGTGRIGKNVVKIAKGFGMNVVAFDLFPDEKLAAAEGFSYLKLENLLEQSDIITIHVPYTKETRHLIHAGNIAKFKRGAYLINTARGEIVETDALLRAIKDGIIAGAGLDVLEGERYIKDELELLTDKKDQLVETKEGFRMLLESHTLMHLPQVLVTPHIAFFSREAKLEILKTTAENIAHFAAGAPQNIVAK